AELAHRSRAGLGQEGHGLAVRYALENASERRGQPVALGCGEDPRVDGLELEPARVGAVAPASEALLEQQLQRERVAGAADAGHGIDPQRHSASKSGSGRRAAI